MGQKANWKGETGEKGYRRQPIRRRKVRRGTEGNLKRGRKVRVRMEMTEAN